MGFFAEIASEARLGMACKQAPITRQTAAAPPPKPDPPAAAPASATPASAPVPEMASAPAESKQEPMAASEPPTIDLTPEADAEEEARRKQAHEAAEAKRKAEFDARQAAKQAARQEQLDKLAAMSDGDAAMAAVKRIGADTERLTRRNMKEAVAEHIQAKCREDASFSRLVMHPAKSMINCFQYINRKAREFAEQEMKDNGIERAGVYGCDVPDGLCFQWAEDYFNDPDVKEDHQNEEKFVPKPYVPAVRKKSQGKTASKKNPAAKKPKGAAASPEQISLI